MTLRSPATDHDILLPGPAPGYASYGIGVGVFDVAVTAVWIPELDRSIVVTCHDQILLHLVTDTRKLGLLFLDLVPESHVIVIPTLNSVVQTTRKYYGLLLLEPVSTAEAATSLSWVATC